MTRAVLGIPWTETWLSGQIMRGVAIRTQAQLFEPPIVRPPFFYFFSPASIAASSFGGDIGSSVSRAPVARSIALAMAAIGGQMLSGPSETGQPVALNADASSKKGVRDKGRPLP
jgi:hypothetical protein